MHVIINSVLAFRPNSDTEWKRTTEQSRQEGGSLVGQRRGSFVLLVDSHGGMQPQEVPLHVDGETATLGGSTSPHAALALAFAGCFCTMFRIMTCPFDHLAIKARRHHHS